MRCLCVAEVKQHLRELARIQRSHAALAALKTRPDEADNTPLAKRVFWTLGRLVQLTDG